MTAWDSTAAGLAETQNPKPEIRNQFQRLPGALKPSSILAAFMAFRIYPQIFLTMLDRFGFRISDFFRPLAALSRCRSGSAFGFRPLAR